MSEKRFTLNLMKKPSEIEMDGKMISKYDVVRLLNEQQDQISYWKHKVNGLLWILSQFDEEKVKELLKELEDE